MTLHRAYLSLGSNILPHQHLPEAVRRLARLGRIAAVSGVWQSRPVGDEAQADFCNAAVLLETGLTPAELTADSGPLRTIEAELGRVRVPHNRNAARTIDIDLSLYDHECRTIGRKTLPDPDLLTRSFVALPLAELDADYLHPVTGEPLRNIAEQLRQLQPLSPRTDIRLSPTP